MLPLTFHLKYKKFSVPRFWALLYARNPRPIMLKNTRSEVGLPSTLHSSTQFKTMAYLFSWMPNFDYTLFLIPPLSQNGYP